MADRSPVEDLDKPRGAKRRWNPAKRLNLNSDTFGRFAEWVAKSMGTAQFLGWMTLVVVLWVTFNVVGLFGFKWDPYPFILLNLFFSTQASYSAPLILLAQNRQEERDRQAVAEDRRVASQSRDSMDYLAREIASLRMSVGELATRDYIRSEIRSELRHLLEQLDEDERRS
ncbi:DUF1003 domain-containing protein [Aestuariimicrobium soli]|uniref:DUF1003 domain-containing protein n=1 Tax=Aestuariimicrobium soli TaxID=2035834 RepID=UPI003EBA787A